MNNNTTANTIITVILNRNIFERAHFIRHTFYDKNKEFGDLVYAKNWKKVGSKNVVTLIVILPVFIITPLAQYFRFRSQE